MDGRVHCRIVRAENLEPLFPLLEGCGTVFLVCDRNVSGTVGKSVADRLGSSFRPAAESCPRFGGTAAGDSLKPGGTTAGACPRLIGTYLLDATEKNKTLATVGEIVEAMLNAGADRSTLVLGVGGGITTDISGFAASVYKRGVRFAFVPTTLLAQTDAAIGGKNGVNFLSYKNMVGTIRQPEFTFITGSALRTLPPEVFLSGVSELLKTFIIADAASYAEAVGRLREFRKDGGHPGRMFPETGWHSGRMFPEDGGQPPAAFPEISDLTARAAEIKAGIVSEDPLEHGLRRVLNLGHTFAHAMETLSGGEIPHGDAVAVGTVMAAGLAERLSGTVRDVSGEVFVCEKGLAERLKADFGGIGLPTECPYAIEDMTGVMAKDKKAEGGGINFILPRRIGEVRIVKCGIDDLFI